MKTVKKIALATAIAAPATLVVGNLAQAAPGNTGTVAIGASFLTDSTAKNNTDSTGLRGAIDFNLPNQTAGASGTPSIDFDYDTNSGHGNHIDTLGVFLSDRFTAKQTKATGVIPYFGAGIGFASIQGSRNVTTGFGASAHTTRRSKSATNFAGKLIAGLNFGQSFVEISYALNGDVDHVDADTIDLAIGTHF
jgi:hypothetical protein